MGLFAQYINKDTITFNGVVFNSDSLTSIPNVHIHTQKNTGTISDGYGQFAFKINKHDTLTFTYVGYKPYSFVIPDTLKINNYIVAIVLNKDTVQLSEVIILPYMNREQFKQAFINYQPDIYTLNATRNLNIANYQALAGNKMGLAPLSMIDYQLQQYALDIEYRGMIPPSGQLNIVGLAKLIVIYSYTQLTKEERKRKFEKELRRHINEKNPK